MRIPAEAGGRGRRANPTPSLRLLSSAPGARLRLLCFPYAGAGGYVYRRWVGRLSPDVDLCAVQLPGHEDRLRERPPADIDVAIDQLVDEFSGYLDGPYAVFGHSLGAVIGAEVARRLVRVGSVRPTHLFVSGSRALADIHRGRRDVHLLGDDELLEHLVRLNGTPAEILENQQMRELILQSLRADYAMLASYSYRPGTELSCPVTVFAGDGDPQTEAYDLHRWAAISSGPTEVITLPGDHFFVHSAQEQLLELVRDRLALTAY